MQTYENIGKNSGIIAYSYDDDSITIQFKKGAYTIYVYTNLSATKKHVDAMKILADKGHGLNSYVSTNKPNHSSKR